MTVTYQVPPREDGIRLASFLRRQGVSVSFIRRVKYHEQGLLHNGVRARTNTIVRAGDIVEVTLPPEKSMVVPPQEIPLQIVYESAHALVVEKPAGLVMHPTLSHHEGTMANAFSHLMKQRGEQAAFRPLGRLDADTSGLVLLAKNAYAAPLLQRSAQKFYLALAEGWLPMGAGSVNAPLGPEPGSVIRQCVTAQGRGSVTEYSVFASNAKASLARVMPQTGRTHQIRVHFAHMGHPLLGDKLYGGNAEYIRRHALHCMCLDFLDPAEGGVSLHSKVPPDIQSAAEAVGLSQDALCEH